MMMRELENKQRLRRRIYSIPALMVLLFITGAMIRGAYSILKTERITAREVAMMKESVETLTFRKDSLEGSIDRLQTEDGIEEEIKSKFNVARAGEKVAIIVDPPEPKATTTPDTDPWYKRLWHAIIGGNE